MSLINNNFESYFKEFEKQIDNILHSEKIPDEEKIEKVSKKRLSDENLNSQNSKILRTVETTDTFESMLEKLDISIKNNVDLFEDDDPNFFNDLIKPPGFEAFDFVDLDDELTEKPVQLTPKFQFPTDLPPRFILETMREIRRLYETTNNEQNNSGITIGKQRLCSLIPIITKINNIYKSSYEERTRQEVQLLKNNFSRQPGSITEDLNFILLIFKELMNDDPWKIPGSDYLLQMSDLPCIRRIEFYKAFDSLYNHLKNRI